ncbi:MAG: type II toxin-antitoxin system PemK/MazF family toxin, partial [Acidimicrobiales bacterium]
MRRGELWTAAGGKHYASKPRPVLVVQDDRFDATDSITVCPVTTDPTEIPLLRIPLQPVAGTGLAEASSLMVDKLTTMPRSKLGECIGAVSDTDMVALGAWVGTGNQAGADERDAAGNNCDLDPVTALSGQE